MSYETRNTKDSPSNELLIFLSNKGSNSFIKCLLLSPLTPEAIFCCFVCLLLDHILSQSILELLGYFTNNHKYESYSGASGNSNL